MLYSDWLLPKKKEVQTSNRELTEEEIQDQEIKRIMISDLTIKPEHQDNLMLRMKWNWITNRLEM